MREDIVILQTCWNRYKLISQSLPQVLAESKALDCPYVLADDQSDDEDVLELLHQAKSEGVEVIQRAYIRDPAEPAHPLIGLNNMFAFGYVLEKYPKARFILKCDDDIVLIPGAFQKMLDGWEKATQDGYDLLMFAGIATKNEPTLKECDGYNITDGACNAAVLYERWDWERFLADAKPGNVMLEGFDCHFLRFYARKYRQGSVCASLVPSQVYHTGYTGTHVLGEELNKDYEGSIEGVIVR